MKQEDLTKVEGITLEEFAREWANFDFADSMNDIIRKRVEENKRRIEQTLEGAMLYTGVVCPEGYQFKDENGNVINATKIVLEKKKDVDLTQEQINAMVHDSCVSFCKHCGCGVPRDTCTLLGTCKEHDDYRKHMRTYLEQQEKGYPKSLRECHDLLGGYDTPQFAERRILLGHYECLLTCRDAYWKIAGEEMGLGKPWEPDYDSGVDKFGIICLDGVVQESNPTTNWERHLNKILDFPTKEMRDAFNENFKKEIESVKELL